MLYRSEVWGGCTKDGETSNKEKYFENHKTSLLELKFLKRILQVRRNTATVAVRGELARHPMAIYTIASSVKYYHRILNSEPTKLVVDSLTESINLHIQGQKTWFSKLENKLCRNWTYSN